MAKKTIDKSTRNRPWKYIARRLAALSVGVMAAFACAEFILRLSAPSWLEYEMSVRANGALPGSDAEWPIERGGGQPLRFVPNSHFSMNHPEYQNTVFTDSLGARTAAGNDQSENRRRVLLVGDSFVFGVGSDYEDSFAGMLASDSSSASDFSACNFGMPGSSLPYQVNQVEWLNSQGVEFETVIFGFFIGNDFADIQEHALGTSKQKTFGSDPSSQSISLPRRLGRQSYLLQLIRAFFRDNTDPAYLDSDIAMMAGLLDFDRIRRAVEQQLDRLVALSNRVGFQVFFLIVPSKNQIVDEAFASKSAQLASPLQYKDRRVPSSFISEIIKSRGIECFDPTDQLMNLEKRDSMYYISDIHFTPLGNKAYFNCVKDPVNDFLSRPR